MRCRPCATAAPASSPTRTRCPVAESLRNPDADLKRRALLAEDALRRRRRARARPSTRRRWRRSSSATRSPSNILALGYAWQRGLVPVSLAALMRAIELNGVAVREQQGRVRARPAGRRRPDGVPARRCAAQPRRRASRRCESLGGADRARRLHLTGYQNAAWAQRFAARRAVRAAAKRRLRWRRQPAADARGGAQPAQADDLQGRVRGRAPLHRRQLPRRSSRSSSKATSKLEFHMAPPLLARPKNGQPPKKMRLGAWMLPALKCWPRASACAARRSTCSATPRSAGWSAGLIDEFEARIDELLAVSRRKVGGGGEIAACR